MWQRRPQRPTSKTLKSGKVAQVTTYTQSEVLMFWPYRIRDSMCVDKIMLLQMMIIRSSSWWHSFLFKLPVCAAQSCVLLCFIQLEKHTKAGASNSNLRRASSRWHSLVHLFIDLFLFIYVSARYRPGWQNGTFAESTEFISRIHPAKRPYRTFLLMRKCCPGLIKLPALTLLSNQ